MATTKADLFHDDLCEILRKHGIEVPGTKLDKPDFGAAFDDFVLAVEAVLDAKEPALRCDHCGGLVTRLFVQRKAELSVCSLCRDGLTPARDLLRRTSEG